MNIYANVTAGTHRDIGFWFGGNGGDEAMRIKSDGKVGIGTSTPDELLTVSGNIKATGNFISGATTLTVPDYVFEEDYPLMPLDELRAFVESEKHLPNVPSAAEIEEDGLNMTEFQMRLLEKIEELTLHVLEQQETMEKQQQAINVLEKRLGPTQGDKRRM